MTVLKPWRILLVVVSREVLVFVLDSLALLAVKLLVVNSGLLVLLVFAHLEEESS